MGAKVRKLDTDWITSKIIGGAIDVHRYLGPGMLEHTYEAYLRLAELEVGLLFNFNVDALAAGGWKRVLRGP